MMMMMMKMILCQAAHICVQTAYIPDNFYAQICSEYIAAMVRETLSIFSLPMFDFLHCLQSSSGGFGLSPPLKAFIFMHLSICGRVSIFEPEPWTVESIGHIGWLGGWGWGWLVGDWTMLHLELVGRGGHCFCSCMHCRSRASQAAGLLDWVVWNSGGNPGNEHEVCVCFSRATTSAKWCPWNRWFSVQRTAIKAQHFSATRIFATWLAGTMSDKSSVAWRQRHH